MTAGFMTSRNNKPVLVSSESVMKRGKNLIFMVLDAEIQFSPRPEEKFFDKRISTGTRATRCNY